MSKEFPKTLIINDYLKLFTSGPKELDSFYTKFRGTPEGTRIGDLEDLTRATILVKDYAHVPSLILDLNQLLESFHGDVAHSSSGYRGIHTNFLQEGMRSELQISTPEVLAIKQEDDYRYHRGKQVDGRLKEISNIDTPESVLERARLKQEKISLNNSEIVARKMFKAIYDKANLPEHVNQIQSLLSLLTASTIEPLNYSFDFLNSTEKDYETCKKVVEYTQKAQQNLENLLVGSLEDYKPRKIIMPPECDKIAEYRQLVHDKLLSKIAETEIDIDNYVIENIKKLTKFEERQTINYTKHSLEQKNWDIPNINDNNIDKLLMSLNERGEKQ